MIRYMLFSATCFAIGFLMAACPSKAEANHSGWNRTTASYYTLYGNRTACGETMSDRSWHVASLHQYYAKCGMRITICRSSRCVHVKVMDSGSYCKFVPLSKCYRLWDLAPRVKRALRCSSVCKVKWHRRWV